MKFCFWILAVTFCCASAAAFAQVTDSALPTDQSTQAEANPQQVLSQENVAQTEAENEPPAQETTDEASRFIPTEQISQDLGVSFPADI